LHQLLKDLGRGDLEHGFGWHRWGRSFRPANNGIVYDYYIRLRSKTEVKPSRDVVDEFLKENLSPRVVGETTPTNIPQEIEKLDNAKGSHETPTKSVGVQDSSELLGRLEKLEQNLISMMLPSNTAIQRINGTLDSLTSDIPNINDNVLKLNSVTQTLSEQLSAVHEDLDFKQAQLEQLEEEKKNVENELKITRTESKDVIPKDYEELRKTNDNLQNLLDGNRTELVNLRADHKKQERQWLVEKDNLENQIQALNEELALEPEEESNLPPEEDDKDDSSKYEEGVVQILKVVFPELVIAHDSAKHLAKDFDLIKLLRMLRAIVIDKADQGTRSTRVQRTKDWYKINIDRTWRLYYCNETSKLDGKVVIVIGNQNTKKRYLDWLRDNTPESCLFAKSP